MQLSKISFAVALAALPLAACVDDSTSADEFAADDATEGDESKADQVSGVYTFYFVQPDYRRCASPYCGGVFYRLANATKTRCIDGTSAERCYAASADWTKLGLGDVGSAKVSEALNTLNGEVLVRATISRQDWGNGLGKFANLNPREAWLAQGPNAADGPLAKVADSGVRCITWPCPSFNEKKLNSSAAASLAELGWDESGATDEQIGNALDKMHTDGLIIAGSRYTISGPGGTGKARTVTQFYLRATDEAPAKTCFASGCSGEVCSDQQVFTACVFRPEYACYQQATCEQQSDGNCGWTQTPELQACLANP
jgi:hypothetical protein